MRALLSRLLAARRQTVAAEPPAAPCTRAHPLCKLTEARQLAQREQLTRDGITPLDRRTSLY
jgi:hypothetical protein